MAERTIQPVAPVEDHVVPPPLWPGPPPPQPRGPLSAHVLEHLLQAPHEVPPLPSFEDDPLWGDDAQLALYCCYELHYRSMAGVHEGWEWEPSLLALRRDLETAFEQRLHEELGLVPAPPDVQTALHQAIDDSSGRSLSAFLRDEGTLDNMREFAVHRSAYQLKEADPHTWAIPRLAGGPKAAMLEIQFDEYGEGVESAMHSTLFAVTMAELGLDSSYGAYLDLLPGATLATTNVISLFGLHRRWRGALVGHLAAFEATSVTPMARYQEALQRLGIGSEAQRFYEVHVDADAHHEIVGFKALAGALAAAEPELAADIVLGGRAMMLVEEHFAHHLLDAWSTDGTSLRAPLPAAGMHLT